MLNARDRLATAEIPPRAIGSATRPDGVASAPAMSFWCQPMADATAYWTVPDTTASVVVEYLKAHPAGIDVGRRDGKQRRR